MVLCGGGGKEKGVAGFSFVSFLGNWKERNNRHSMTRNTLYKGINLLFFVIFERCPNFLWFLVDSMDWMTSSSRGAVFCCPFLFLAGAFRCLLNTPSSLRHFPVIHLFNILFFSIKKNPTELRGLSFLSLEKSIWKILFCGWKWGCLTS